MFIVVSLCWLMLFSCLRSSRWTLDLATFVLSFSKPRDLPMFRMQVFLAEQIYRFFADFLHIDFLRTPRFLGMRINQTSDFSPWSGAWLVLKIRHLQDQTKWCDDCGIDFKMWTREKLSERKRRPNSGVFVMTKHAPRSRATRYFSQRHASNQWAS